jgi:tetratricopeptide (TPR) repeat protein
MKSALFRRVLFAVTVASSAAACGDKPASTPEVAPEPAVHRATPPQIAVAPPTKPGKAEVPAPAPMPEPKDFADAMKLGKAAAAKRDVAVARAMFDAASRLDDTAAEPQLELARLFLDAGEKKLALASAKKATKLAPESSAAWNTLGRAQLVRFAYDDAITAFEKAIDKNPNNAYAWNNLGFTNLELELWSEARNALEEATALPDATGYMFNNLGLAYEQLEMFEDARLAFDEGSELGSAAARYNRGRLEGVTRVASAEVIVHDDVAIIEENGLVDEAEIVEEAIEQEEDAALEEDIGVEEIEDAAELADDAVDPEPEMELPPESDSKTI